MGYKYFPFSQSQGYTPQTCADACTLQTGYDSRHPAADGSYRTCVRAVLMLRCMMSMLTINRSSSMYTCSLRMLSRRDSTVLSTTRPGLLRMPRTTDNTAVLIATLCQSRTAICYRSERLTVSTTRNEIGTWYAFRIDDFGASEQK